MLNQYHNPDNIEAHYQLTGPEIEKDARAAGFNLDFFVRAWGPAAPCQEPAST